MNSSRLLATVAAVLLSAGGVSVGHPAAATADRMAPPCSAVADKTAAPNVVLVGQAVTVTLHLEVTCPGQPVPTDIVLVLDRSTSMLGPPMVALRLATQAFVDMVDLDRHRIGVVSFADDARVDAQLSHERSYLRGAIDRLHAKGGTDIADGLRQAGRMLGSGNAGALPVIVLVTDGFDENGDLAVRQAADYQRNAGITLITIAVEYGAAVSLLREISSSPDLAFVAPTPQDIAGMYRRIGDRIQGATARDAEIVDELPFDMTLVGGSASPPATIVGGRLVWNSPLVPAEGITMTYRVRPQTLGRRPTNIDAHAAYSTSGGGQGGASFPIPYVEVVAALPSATPTASATATRARPSDTPTPTPSLDTPETVTVLRYLPALSAAGCPPTGGRVDVVLVLDASTTMMELTATGRTKLQAAVEGALALSRALTDRGKRMGLVTFHHAARELTPLTEDPSRIEAALAGVEVAAGSRIDLGLLQAARTVTADEPSRAPGVRRIALLATDGRPAGADAAEVVAAARALRAVGIELFAVAVGSDADFALLAQLASSGFLWSAGDGEGFEAAANEVLALVDCR